MIIIKNDEELKCMRASCGIAARVRDELARRILDEAGIKAELFK